MASLYDIGFNPRTMYIDDSGQIRLKNEEASRAMIEAKDYKNYKMSTSPVVNSEEEENDDKFNFIDYLPFGNKSISGSIMRGIGQYMPERDPRQTALNQFYDVNNGTIQSGLMKDYNPVSGGFLNTITGGRFGDPTNYGLQNAYQKRMDTINKTLQRQYTDEEGKTSFDKTGLDERLTTLRGMRDDEQRFVADQLGQNYTGDQDMQNVVDNTGRRDATGGAGITAQDQFSNKTGRGRTGYYFGGRVGYKVGGRTDRMGGTMEQTASELRAAAPDQFGGGMKINQGGNNGGDNFLTENNTPPTNVGNTSAMKQDNIMNAILSSRYNTDLKEDVDNPKFSMKNMFGITSQVPENMQLAKVYGAPELTKFGATPGRFMDTDKFNDMEKYQELANKQMSFDKVDGSYRGKQPSDIRESIALGEALYGINMDNIPEDFLETQADYKKQKILGDIKFSKGGRAMFKNGGLASIL